MEWVMPPFGRDAFKKIMQHVKLLTYPPVILEIGTTRKEGNIVGDGYSTPFFAYLANTCEGEFYSIDIDPEAIRVSTKILSEYNLLTDKIHLICGDAIGYIAGTWRPQINKKLDVLYLDGWDWVAPHTEDSSLQHFLALRLLESCLQENAIVAIDDVVQGEDGKLIGKGDIVVPYLLGKGYCVIDGGYACALSKVKNENI